MIIDTYLPHAHFREFHCITINSSKENTYPIMLQCNHGKSKLVTMLFWLRGMPVRITTIDQLSQLGFIRLGENQAAKFFTEG
jgi:hypothetical protein